MNKSLYFLVVLLTSMMFTACGGGSTSSGGDEAGVSGQKLPANYIGVYIGQLNLMAEALGVSDSDSFAITITVSADSTVRFDGDSPDETFTVDISDSGVFSGQISIDEDECNGNVAVNGTVDGVNATGSVQGDGQCVINGITVDVVLSGDFAAVK